MLLISRAGTSFCTFVGNTNVPGEEGRSREVCSFRDFKAHSSKDVAITILASSLCLGWPFTFQEEIFAGLQPAQTYSLECSVPENIPFLAFALCFQSQLGAIFAAPGRVRRRGEWDSEDGLPFSSSALLPGVEDCKQKNKPGPSPQGSRPLISVG